MFVHVEVIPLTPGLANRSSLSKDAVITHSYVPFGSGLYRSVISCK